MSGTGLAQHQRPYTLLNNAFTLTLAVVALVLWVAALLLPVTYGAEIFGVMPGWLVLLEGLIAWRHGGILLATPLLLPLSFIAARKSFRWAALLAGAALTGPVYLLVSDGWTIDAFLSGRKVPALGLLCWLLSGLLLTAGWVLAARSAPTRKPS